MAFPPVTPEALAELTNSDLGRELLISYIHAEVEAEGIAAHEYDATDVERIRQMILRAETNFARNAALEKALHKAAIGDYETGGRLFREWYTTAAIAERFLPIGIERSAQQREFGRPAAEASAKVGAENRARVKDARDAILSARTRPISDRGLALEIEEKTGINRNTERGQLVDLRKEEKIPD